jgi:YegS/Rv2252/BmrU family lipid kinase
VAHRRKTLGGGLDQLRKLLVDEGVPDPIWYEVNKSAKAGGKARKALRAGADLIFVWGGDGMIQRCADALAGSSTTMAILPAGTANLLATNLGIPRDLPAAVRIGLTGRRRVLDLGKVNGEHFAVMAGAGFDAKMIRDADAELKETAGRLGYIWTGLRHVTDSAVRMKIRVDGARWFSGRASCLLFGNVGRIAVGIPAFPEARTDDGQLEIGVATAKNPVQWARTLAKLATGRAERSPFVRTTRGTRVEVVFGSPTVYELDGGDRPETTRLKVRAVPAAITVRVPD